MYKQPFLTSEKLMPQTRLPIKSFKALISYFLAADLCIRNLAIWIGDWNKKQEIQMSPRQHKEIACHISKTNIGVWDGSSSKPLKKCLAFSAGRSLL